MEKAAPEIVAYNPDYASKEMSDRLIRISEDLFGKLGDVKKKILVGHWSIQGAVTSSGKTMEATLTGVETVLPMGDLVRQGWDACLFGHIHVPQVLCDKEKDGPFIAYSGCIQRINVGEAGDVRGFYIYDTKTADYEFFRLPAIPMKVFSKEIKRGDDFEELLAEIKEKPLAGKYAYVKYLATKDNFALVDKKAIELALKEQNPLSIIGIKPKIVLDARQRDSSLTESLDNETALGKWLSNKQVDDARAKRVMEKYKDIMDAFASAEDEED